MKNRIFASLMVLFFTQNAIAAEKSQFQAVGFGLSSCGKYINSPKDSIEKEKTMVKKILFLTLLSVISGPLNAGDIFEKYKNAQPVEPAGSWSKKLIKYVAQDQGVDKSAVQLYKQHEGEGQGDYVVKVNDAFFAYKRIGTVYSRSKAGQRDLSAANALQQKFKDAAPLAPKGGWGKKMVSYVAQDLGVDASAVQLFKQYEGSGQGEYVVKVNGEFYEYKRMGSVYYEAGNPPF